MADNPQCTATSSGICNCTNDDDEAAAAAAAAAADDDDDGDDSNELFTVATNLHMISYLHQVTVDRYTEIHLGGAAGEEEEEEKESVCFFPKYAVFALPRGVVMVSCLSGRSLRFLMSSNHQYIFRFLPFFVSRKYKTTATCE